MTAPAPVAIDRELRERRNARARALKAATEPAPVALRRQWQPGAAILVPELEEL